MKRNLATTTKDSRRDSNSLAWSPRSPLPMASEYNSQRYHNTQSSLHSQQPTQAKNKDLLITKAGEFSNLQTSYIILKSVGTIWTTTLQYP